MSENREQESGADPIFCCECLSWPRGRAACRRRFGPCSFPLWKSAPCPPIFFEERLKTPIGVMLVLTDAQGRLRAVDWDDYESRMHKLLGRQYGKAVALRPATAASGRGAAWKRISTVGSMPSTPWRWPWAAPCSSVRYGRRCAAFRRAAISTMAGSPSASAGPRRCARVGAANGANPIGIVVPCHRVIGANAALTGYGGGLHRKRWLLEHEGAAGFAPA